MVQTDWYYARGGRQEGPTDLQTLRDMIASGQLMASDLAWRDGMTGWQAAAEVPALRDAFDGGGGSGGALGGVGATPTGTTPTGVTGGYAAPQTAYTPQGGYPQQQQQVYPSPGPYTQPGKPYVPPYALPVGYYGGAVGRSYVDDARNAMIVAIIGIFCVGIVLGPVGIVLGHGAKRNMRASGNFDGDGMATAAIVIGWIVVGLHALLFVLGFSGAMFGA